MMDIKLNCVDVDDGRGDDKSKSHDNSDNANSPITPDSSTEDQTRSLTEVTILLEQIPKEDKAPADSDLPNNPNGEVNRTLPISGPWSVEEEQPQPLSALLPSSTGHCTVYEMSQSCTSISRSQQSLKTSADQMQPSDGGDPCAAILMACLFCHPLDCLAATVTGCNACVTSLCASLCGCEPTALQPLLGFPHHCDCCGCLGARRCLCDCLTCDICLPATECLDLAMEISQMLYH